MLSDNFVGRVCVLTLSCKSQRPRRERRLGEFSLCLELSLCRGAEKWGHWRTTQERKSVKIKVNLKNVKNVLKWHESRIFSLLAEEGSRERMKMLYNNFLSKVALIDELNKLGEWWQKLITWWRGGSELKFWSTQVTQRVIERPSAAQLRE